MTTPTPPEPPSVPATPPPAPDRRLLRTALIATAVLALAAPAAVLAAARTAPPRQATVQPARTTPVTSAPAATATSVSAPTPQQWLLSLADQIAAVPQDAHTGRVDYTHVQLWARATDVVARFDTEKWWAADGSGRVRERRLRDRPDLTRPPSSDEHRQLLTGPAGVQDYRPGRLPPEVKLPIATGVQALQAQFDTISPPAAGPLSTATAISNINRTHYLNRANRADTLRVLATVATLEFRGPSTDVAGRTGLTWAIDTGGGTELLTFDPRTGELLVHQSLLDTQPAGLFSYELFLHRDRVDQPGQAPSTDPQRLSPADK
jgi:hypothetical protein